MNQPDPLTREREAQRVVNAYHRLFGGECEEGNLILADLKRVFGWDHPTFLPSGNFQGFDALHAAKRDGQQDIRRHLEAKLAAPRLGEANVTEPRARVIT